MKALVFGEILWDIIEGNPHLGGAPLNFAAHVKKCGGESSIISCLGNDDLGDKALGLVKEAGVDVSLVQRSNRQTGYVPVKIVDGQPKYEIVKDVAYDYIETSELFDNPFDIFYFGSLIQRSKISRKSLYKILDENSFSNIFYDVNLRKDCYSADIIQKSLAYCTVLKLNDEEVSEISEMLFNENLTFEQFCVQVINVYPNVKTIIITAGPDGAYVYTDKQLTLVPTDPIKVVDTVGAGDSFSAAFATVFAKTQDAIRAATIANKIGGFVASSAGPIPEYSQEIKDLLL